ncbi:MAG: undecaprenyldiphospho-muramoylpentapeptide beta-N-acetylglucosaminyltransferase [Pseudomonadota bacterium]
MAHMLVTGGGTAGHVLPALPVMRTALDEGWQVSFIGTHSGLEADLIEALEVEFYAVATGKLRRYFSWENVTDLLRVLLGIWQSYWLLGRLRPDVVFSKGGFVSFPVGFAAWLRRIPVVAHESDLTPGLANRLLLPFVSILCTSFAAEHEDSKRSRRHKIVHTGTPLREVMRDGDATRGRAFLGLDDRPLLVVTGGSLGAAHLNAVVRDALPELLTRYAVVHVCGPGKRAALELDGYQQFEYLSEEWGDVVAAADVVLSRAGANSLFEWVALGKLNILVPLSAKASRGDQIDNAAYAERHGLSLVVVEEDLNPASLQAALADITAKAPDYLARLRAFDVGDATSAIFAQLRAASGL